LSPPRGYLARTSGRLRATPRGGGFEYLHCSPASCRRRRKESPVLGVITGLTGLGLKNDYAGEDPAAIVNDRPILSSERAPHVNKPATVCQ
jgi:hypothetical protein